MKRRRVRIVLPAHNEEQALETSLKRLHAYCRRDLPGYDWEILIANNGSSDGTTEIANRLARQTDRVFALSLPVAGRGGALRTAALLPGADYLLYMDVDLSTSLDALPRLLMALDRGADVAIGSRHLPDSRVTRGLYRALLSRTYNLLLKAMFGVTSFKDAQCGFKAFRLRRLQPLLALVRDHRWFFDTEVLILAEYSGLRVEEIPVNWVEDPDSRVEIPSAIAQKLLGVARLRFTARKVAGTQRTSAAGR